MVSLPRSFQVSARGQRLLTFQQQAQQFAQQVPVRETEAATAATKESRAVYTRWLGKRPLAPARPGRPTTMGNFVNDITWERDGKGYIDFDVDRMAPYYLIQEIGTGQSATILAPPGKPPGSVSVKYQTGRRIPMSLYWAPGPGATASKQMSTKDRKLPNGAVGTNDQLYLSTQVNANAAAAARKRPMTIRREIKGKHYLRDGGLTGFNTLADGLSADAKRIFR
jgi:hypothetical protein